MTHPISFHDQVLKFIQTDSYSTHVDGGISFALIAREFENYWRAVIAVEVNEFLMDFADDKRKVLTSRDKQNLLLTIWSTNDKLK